MPSHLVEWVTKLAKQRILVVGDVILDEYLIGSTSRLSREAPVPVLEFEERRLIAGGAANPAANIVSLGSEAIQAGVIGSDTNATNLRQVLQVLGITTNGLIIDPGRPTTVKTRIMAHMGLRFPQQVARLDTLSREEINEVVERRLRTFIFDCVKSVNAVLLSDYHIGLMTPSLVETVRKLAEAEKVIITADAQGFLDKYKGVTLVKCNADEARAYLHRDLRSDSDFAHGAEELLRKLKLRGAMVITRGADGATVAIKNAEALHIPAPDVTDVYDTVGAGDTAIAVITLGIAAGMTYPDAVLLANYASGIVVRRVGNYTPKPAELQQALQR